MQLPPASVILAWPKPNYENPSEVHGPAILILTMIFVPLTLFLLFARIYTRLRISRSFGADDILIIIATVPAIVCGLITAWAALKLGWNRHVYDVPFNQLQLGLKLVIVVEVFFSIGVGFTKLSLLAFTLRIMKGSANKMLENIVIITMAVIGIYTIIFVFFVIFTCKYVATFKSFPAFASPLFRLLIYNYSSPIHLYWTLSTKPQNCIDEGAHLRASGVINTLTDLLVVLLPIPTVMSLKLYARQRFILALLFGTGFIIVISGSIRAFFTYRLSRSYDKTWDAYPLWVAATVEMYLGIIAASMPTLKPFFSRFLTPIFGSILSQRDAASSLFSQLKRNRRAGNSKARTMDSSQATTVVNGDLEFSNLSKGEMGVLSANVSRYSSSRISLHSMDATSQSELRTGGK
ncbi:hypothetical protein MaudCBS49596_002784 [Microsporum audouinii]